MAGEAHAGAVANQDPRAHETRPQARCVRDGDQQEVRVRGRERVAALGQPGAEVGALLEHESPRLFRVRVVLEGRQRRDLSEPVHVVGRADAIESIDRLHARHRVAHAQAREPRDLRERAEHDEARVALEEPDPVDVVGVVAEIHVGLIEDYERRIRAERVEKREERSPVDDRRRRVVR